MQNQTSGWSAGRFFETFGPAIAVVLWLLCSWFYKNEIQSAIAAKQIEISGLFSAVFGWAAIQTGFIFSVFGFVASKSDGFVGAIRRLPVMESFIGHVRLAMYAGFILTVSCIPLMVLKLEIASTPVYYVVSCWMALFVWAFSAFLRVALNFGRMITVRDDDHIPG